MVLFVFACFTMNYVFNVNVFEKNRECTTFITIVFNTDVKKTSKSCSLYSSFSSFIDMFNYTQLIHDFTRICSTSSTTIDLILVSDSNNISQSGVIETSFSDHYMIFCTRKLSKSFIGSHNNITTRSLKNYSSEIFQANLLATDWSSVILCDNASEAWEHFKNIFMSVIDNIEPIKQHRIKQRT
jgi:hypothetical protein